MINWLIKKIEETLIVPLALETSVATKKITRKEADDYYEKLNIANCVEGEQ